MKKFTEVWDRIYLNYPGRNLAIEYIDGFCTHHDESFNEWRLIDLDTGVVESKSERSCDVIHHASILFNKKFNNEKKEYIPEKAETCSWNDLPLSIKLDYVQSHAADLEEDFNLDGITRCPLEAALTDFSQRYSNKDAFVKNIKTGEWEMNPY